ncbi:MAG: glycosyltransferase, partial [Chloroflexota bacterium]
LGSWTSQPALARVLPRTFGEAHRVAPFAIYRGRLLIAIAGVDSIEMLREASRLTGYPVAPVIASQAAITSALRVAWGTRDATPGAEAQAMASAQPSTVAMLKLALGDRSAGAPTVDPQVAGRVPHALLRRLGGLPTRYRARKVEVAVKAPLSSELRELYELLYHQPVQELVLSPAAFDTLQEQHFPPPQIEPAVVWPANWWQHEEPFESFLLSLGYLTRDQADAARRLGRGSPGLVRRVLMESGALTEDTMAEGLGLWLGLPWIEVEQWLPEPEVLRMVPKELALRFSAMPLVPGPATLTVAASAPDHPTLGRDLAEHTGRPVRMVVAARSPLNRTLRRWYQATEGDVSPEFVEVTSALVAVGRLTPTDRTYWAETCLRSDEAPDQTVVRLGLLPEEEVAQATARALALPLESLLTEERYETVTGPDGVPITLRHIVDPVQGRIAQVVAPDLVRKHGAIPVRRQAGELVVAFAWPGRETIAAIEAVAGEPVRPVVARRSHIEAALARQTGRPRLGDLMLTGGLVRSDQLDQAAAYAARNGLRLGAALVSLGYITENQLVSVLAAQFNTPHFDIIPDMVDLGLAGLIPKAFIRERQLLPVSLADNELLVAMVDPQDSAALNEVEQLTGHQVNPVLVTPTAFATAYQTLFQDEDIHSSASQLMEMTPEDSAARVLSNGQKAFGLGFLLVMVGLFAWQPLPTLIGLVTVVNLFYLCISFYRFYLIFNGMGRSLEIEVAAAEVGALDERDLPVYTILVPLYKEAAVLPVLTESIARLDYPKAKLDVKLLLEEDDVDTIAVARAANLPSHFNIIVVPNRPPKGKPKACNFGLLQAKGSFVVIFDAEDVPEADQLKRVVIAFRKSDKRLGCVQCKLNYYNRDQNLLTRWFTSEYSMWFDLFLPGLNAVHAPIPLGG